MYRKILLISIISLQISGCSASDTTKRALNTIEDNTSVTWNKARDLTGLGRKKPQQKITSQARYCYKSYEDITCYGQPIPGNENRLVAYQGNTGQTGYILPGSGRETGSVILPPLKSVNVGTPPKIADSDTVTKNKKQLKEIIFDPAELQPRELVPRKSQ